MKTYPILMYHRILSDRCPVPKDNRAELRYAVDVDAFTRQMDYLVQSGLRGVSLGKKLDGIQNGDTASDDAIVLSFDDGNRSDVEHALPLLAERGFTATFFIGCDRIGQDGGLSEVMIRDLADGGMEIGAHGVTHRFMSLLEATDQRNEGSASKKMLSQTTGQAVRFFALPGGRYNTHTMGVLKDVGYEAVCTSKFGYNDPESGSFVLKRIPVLKSTSDQTFKNIVHRSTGRLIPEFVRSESLDVFRNLLGERSFQRLRSLFPKG